MGTDKQEQSLIAKQKNQEERNITPTVQPAIEVDIVTFQDNGRR